MRAGQPRVSLTRQAALTLAALAALMPATPASAQTVDSRVRLDTVGYLPGHDKRASVPARFDEFKVRREPDGAVAFGGKASGPRRNEDTGEDIYYADFSALREPGTYFLDVPNVGRSAPFRVGAGVYVEPFRAAFEAMYLWRCGSAVSLTRNGTAYSHAACHLADARLDCVGRPGERRDSAGGWHDAGDYNKYVVNAGITVGIMLRAWEEFGPRIERIRFDLPR